MLVFWNFLCDLFSGRCEHARLGRFDLCPHYLPRTAAQRRPASNWLLLQVSDQDASEAASKTALRPLHFGIVGARQGRDIEEEAEVEGLDEGRDGLEPRPTSFIPFKMTL